MANKAVRYSASTSRSGLYSRESNLSKACTRAENTYRLEPASSFPGAAVKAVLEDVLGSNLQERPYSANECSVLARDLAGVVRNRVRGLGLGRYKVVVTVTVGEKEAGVSSRVASRCLWDDRHDTHVDYYCENRSLYAVGVVYGVYME